MKIYKVKSFAKINLVLHVTGKLKKLHKIESIVKFIQLHDLITIKITKGTNHKISFNGHFSKNIKKDNTVHNLFKILDEKNLLNNKFFSSRILNKL